MMSSKLPPLAPNNEKMYYFKKKKNKKTVSEKFYHSIQVDHFYKTKYPGRFGNIKTGEKECETFKSAYSCEMGIEKHVFLHSCNNINCPKCYINSIKATSKRSADRFEHVQAFLSNLGFKKHYLRHISFNIQPEKEIRTYLDLVKIRKAMTSLLKKLKCSGVLIYHPYRRKKNSDGSYYYPLKLVYSPHFHFIGHGWIPCNFRKKYGFTVTFIRWLFSRKQTYNALKYSLTHAGYFENKHILTWFGHYSYNKLVKINKKKVIEDLKCKCCDELIYKINTNGLMIRDRKNNVYIPYSQHLDFNFERWLKEITWVYDFEYKNRKKINKSKHLNIRKSIYYVAKLK